MTDLSNSPIFGTNFPVFLGGSKSLDPTADFDNISLWGDFVTFYLSAIICQWTFLIFRQWQLVIFSEVHFVATNIWLRKNFCLFFSLYFENNACHEEMSRFTPKIHGNSRHEYTPYRSDNGCDWGLSCLHYRSFPAHQSHSTSRDSRRLLRLWRWFLQSCVKGGCGLWSQVPQKCRLVFKLVLKTGTIRLITEHSLGVSFAQHTTQLHDQLEYHTTRFLWRVGDRIHVVTLYPLVRLTYACRVYICRSKHSIGNTSLLSQFWGRGNYHFKRTSKLCSI